MRADAREKRAALVRAAWTLVAQEGPEVSLRAIAAEAGVGIATLYRHFPTRDDLVIGVIGELADRVTEVIDRHRDNWDGSRDNWVSFIHDIADLKLAAVAERSIATIPEDSHVWEDTEPVRERMTVAYASILGLAAEEGFVGPDVTPWRFHLGLAAVSRPMPPKVEVFAPGQADWLLDNFITGLQGSVPSRG